MAENKNSDKLVYYTDAGDRYHIFLECPYIKNSKTVNKTLRESKLRKKKLCQWCKGKKTNKNNINPLIKNNPAPFQNDNINNDNNINKNSNFLIQKSKSINPVSNNNLKKAFYNNVKEEEDKQIEDSKNSISGITNNFSDSFTINESLTQLISKPSSLDEKNIIKKFNNNNLEKIKKVKESNIKNNNIEGNNIINNISENDIIPLKKIKDKNFVIKEEEENKENSFNDINKDDKVIYCSLDRNINNSNYKKDYNDKSLKNSLISDLNITNKSGSESEPKINILDLNNHKDNSSKNDSSSYSSSKINNDNIINVQDNDPFKNIYININNTIINQSNISHSISDFDNNKFSIEVIPKNKKPININIELGFKILCIEESKSSINLDQDSSESSEDTIIPSKVFEEYSIFRQFNIFKRVNFNVLIDISKGKLNVIKMKDNINTKNNDFFFQEKNSILSSFDCQKFPLDKIKEINPIFKYNSDDLKLVDIIFNGEKVLN